MAQLLGSLPEPIRGVVDRYKHWKNDTRVHALPVGLLQEISDARWEVKAGALSTAYGDDVLLNYDAMLADLERNTAAKTIKHAACIVIEDINEDDSSDSDPDAAKDPEAVSNDMRGLLSDFDTVNCETALVWLEKLTDDFDELMFEALQYTAQDDDDVFDKWITGDEDAVDAEIALLQSGNK